MDDKNKIVQPDKNNKDDNNIDIKSKNNYNAYHGSMGENVGSNPRKNGVGNSKLVNAEKLLNKNPIARNALNLAQRTGALDKAVGGNTRSSGNTPSSSGNVPKKSGDAPGSSMNLEDSDNTDSKSSLNPLDKLKSNGKKDQEVSSDVDVQIDASTKMFDFVMKHWKMLLAPILSFSLIMFIIMIILIGVQGPAATVVEFFTNAWDSMVTFVTGDKSLEDWELKYYQTLDEVQETLNKKFGVCVDINLITATLTVNVANDKYLEEGSTEVDPGAQGGSELGLTGADYKKMIQQIELLGNMQIRRTIYGLDERVKVTGDYCKDQVSEYLFTAKDDKKDFKYKKSTYSPLLGPLGELAKSNSVPVRDSTSPRLIAQNDLEPGIWKFFTRKVNEERNIEYKFFVPAYITEEQKDSQGNVIGTKKVCREDIPEDPYDFAKLDIGSLNDMENNVYYWNLVDNFIVNYYQDYLPEINGEIVEGSEQYVAIHNMISDIYLLYNDMGPSRMCDSEAHTNQCSYVGVNGEKLNNVKVELLQCADDTRFDPIPSENVIDLETYITGVVYAENGGSSNYEALKAQAVAARTYALTKNDKMETDANGDTLIKIRNCTERQVYCDPNNGCWSNDKKAGGTVHSGQDSSKPYSKPPLPTSSNVWSAVRETAGEVLYDANGNILPINYSSTQQNMWNKMTSDYITMLMATYSAAESVNSDCKTVGDVNGPGTQPGNLTPSNCSNYSSSSSYWGSLNIFSKPQCTWYAFGRGLQILTEDAGMDINSARTLLQSMYSESSGRHAGQWYRMNAETQTFSASTDINAAKPGAFIIWGNNDPDNPYGHVAVVEAVNKNSDGTVSSLTITEGNVKMDNGTVRECFYRTRSRSEILTPSNTRYFIGYIYLLD